LKIKCNFAHSIKKVYKQKVINCLHLYESKAAEQIVIAIKKIYIMQKGIHPENYRLVAFKDMSNEDVFITKSTVETKETITHEGIEYPVFKMEISRTSHPFYTGKSKLIDTAGRIDKFNSKYAKKAK
jgi:large subunit ribosomal protein L31